MPQLEQECTLLQFMLEYCRLLAADLDDSQLADQPGPGMNHPAWILGHLAVSSDYALRMLGEPMRCPKEWYRLFGRGSEPTPERAAYPAKADLIAALEGGYQAIREAVGRAPAERLQATHNIAFLAKPLPTVRDLLAHLMTTHLGLHVGQLSTWRRLKGLAPLV